MFRCSFVICINTYKCNTLLLDWPLYYYTMTFFVSYYSFVLKSVLSDIYTPAFFWFSLALNIFFLPVTFSVYEYGSLHLKWVSYRQHTNGSCFIIYSATLCLLVRECSPFTFKVIINRHVLFDILFIVIWLVCNPLFLSPFDLFLCDWMILCSGVLA